MSGHHAIAARPAPPPNGYALARRAGLQLRPFRPNAWQLHNGAHVLAIIEGTERGYTASVAAHALAPDAPTLYRYPGGWGGWAVMGRSATLRGAVALALRGAGRHHDTRPAG